MPLEQEMSLIRCKIHRGAFSGERGVEIRTKTKLMYDGALPVAFLRTEAGDEISETVPSKEAPVPGVVRARLLTVGDGRSLRLPDGTTFPVDDQILSEIRS